MDKITGSVGRSGVNSTVDAKFIQKLLNAQEFPGEITRLTEDGKIGDKTISRIEAFQKKILKMFNSDGGVDSNGETFKKLLENQDQPGTKATSLFSFSESIGADSIDSECCEIGLLPTQSRGLNSGQSIG